MKKKIAVVVVALALVGAFGYWRWLMPGSVVSVRAVVEGEPASVSVAVPGTVAEAYVSAGETVAQGQPLFALDKAEYEQRLARERIRLAELAAGLPANVAVPSPIAAEGQLAGKPLAALRQEEEEARAAVDVAAGVLAQANIALSRMDNVSASKNAYAGTDPGRQAALIARDEAAIAVRNAREEFDKVSYARAQREAREKAAGSGGLVSAATAARIAEYQAQVSRVRLAERDIAATVVVAPEKGRVLLQAALPGTRLAAGDTPVTLQPAVPRNLRVLAYFAAGDAAKLAPGQECRVVFGPPVPSGTSAGAGRAKDRSGGEASEEAEGATAAGRIDALSGAPDAGNNIAVAVVLERKDKPLRAAPGREARVTVMTGGAFSFADPLKK